MNTILAALFALFDLFPVVSVTPIPQNYLNFETVPNRALALTRDGEHLLALNVPDSRLEIFAVEGPRLRAIASVVVGLDPVAVAISDDGSHAWVANHLSDSVSVVDIRDLRRPIVVATLPVGDQPRDIVFADRAGRRAFVSCVRRGQNHPAGLPVLLDEALGTSPGLADVWVFDVASVLKQGASTPLSIVTLFADKPGNMEVSRDRSRVYVGIFSSGNQTATVSTVSVCSGDAPSAGFGQLSAQGDGPCLLRNGGVSPGGTPGPDTNQADGAPHPRSGTIVKFDERTGGWLDAARRDWRAAVPFELPDKDVFVIDARGLRVIADYPHVGTLNHNMAVHPKTGEVFVANIDAVNTNRFLSLPQLNLVPNPTRAGGAAQTADPLTGKTLNGHLYEAQITILSPKGGVARRHLNKHIDYERVPSPPGVKERSVAEPRGLVFSPDARSLYVAALGSNRVVRFDTARLRDDSFVPDAGSHMALSGAGGPTDMVMTPSGRYLFVYRRFDNAISTLDLRAGREVASRNLYSPEPQDVRAGRKFLYDAQLTSSNGEANCNVCHPGGDKDDLAWDFGAPFLNDAPIPNLFVPFVPDRVLEGGDAAARASNQFINDLFPDTDPIFSFTPFKGPMTVLTLRGIRDNGPMFWRGDATNAVDPGDESRNFQAFNTVFPALLGREAALPQSDFDALTDFVFSITSPPNPYQPLDNSLLPEQEQGRALFFGEQKPTDGPLDCENCHRTQPELGLFGTAGENAFIPENTEHFKVPSLRPTFDKVGVVGATVGIQAPGSSGPQLRGSGFSHDGSRGSLLEFQQLALFNATPDEMVLLGKFMLAFPTDTAPIVGQQITLNRTSGAESEARVQLFAQRAAASFTRPRNPTGKECDLIAHTRIASRSVGLLLIGENKLLASNGLRVRLDELIASTKRGGAPVTFTCVYPGAGQRLAIDRDGDGLLDAFDRTLEGPGASAAGSSGAAAESD